MSSLGNSLILYVEDDPAHSKLVERGFRKSLYKMELESVTSLEEAKIHLNHKKYHLVIADYRLADGDGLALVEICLEKLIPLIVLTSQGSESIAVEALKKGAFDYVVKSESTLADMSRIAFQALKEWDLILKRKQSEKLLRQIADSLITQLIVLNSQGSVILSNNALNANHNCPLIPADGFQNSNYLNFLTQLPTPYQDTGMKLHECIQKAFSGIIREDMLSFSSMPDSDDKRHYELTVKSITNPLENLVLITIDDMTERYKHQKQAELKEQNLVLIKKLSPREKEVLKLVAKGISNKKIAYELHLSDRTVEKHRASAMKKLRIKSVADIVKIFVNTDID